MFQFFRRRDTAVRVFLGGLLVLICVMMVVTLIPGLTGSGPSTQTVLAKVDGEPITSSELLHQLQQMTRNRRMPPSMIPLYAPQILSQMVSEKVVLREARRMGLMVSTGEMVQELRLNPQLFPGGQYIGEDQYRALVETRFGMSVPEFEDKFREGLLMDKLRRIITAGASVGGAEVAREFHRRNDKMRIEFVLLKTGDVKDSLNLSDAGVADYFHKTRSRYQMPERRQFKLVFIDTSKLKETVPVTEQDLQRFYNENKDRFRVEDRVKVSHILFRTTGKTAEEAETIRKKAEDVLKRARGGEDFAKLAKQYSDDAATTPKGGDLGWIVHGQTVPEFEKAAFTLPPGSISDPIKTVYGVHILKIETRERAHLRTLQDVTPEITPQVKAEKASRAAEDLVRKAEGVLKKTPGNLQAVASQLGLPVIDTGMVKRGDPLSQAGPASAAEDTLFAANMKPGQLTPLIPVPNGIMIASLVQDSPAHPAELSEVRDQVENDFRNEKAAQVTASRVKEVAELARKGGDLKKAAASQKLTVKESEPFNRDGSVKDMGAASSLGENAFSMKVGDIGGPVAVTDGQVVFRVSERLPASEEELAKTRDSIRRDMLEQKRSTLFQLFTDGLKDRLEHEGKLKVDQTAMDRLTSSFQ